MLKPQWRYEVRMSWASCRYQADGNFYPNYDYTLALVAGGRPAQVVLDDPGGIFREAYCGFEYYGGAYFPELASAATLYVLGRPGLVPDYNRDGKINDDDDALVGEKGW